MSHLDSDPYTCLDCNKTFNHYDSSMGIVKCPYCGSTRVKIKTKEIVQQIDGKTETTTETEIIITHSSMLEKIILLAIAFFVMAFIIPPALTTITTSAFTKVNQNVVTLFSILFPIVPVIGVVFLIFSQVRNSE